MSATDVVVVGGGIVGAAIAHELARAGATVTVVERDGGWGRGASWGNAGLIVPSHARPIAAPESLRDGLRWMVRRDSPFGLRLRMDVAPWLVRYAAAATGSRAHAGERLQRTLAVESLELLAELTADGIDADFERSGCLTVHTGEDAAERAAQEAESESGRELGAQVLSAAEIRELEPGLTAAARAGVLFPREARCDPVRLTAALGAAAEAHGARMQAGVEAYALRARGDGVTVETTTGPIDGAHAVLAAGAWSGVLARTLGIRLPLQGGKGYAIEYDRPAMPIRRPLYLQDQRCVVNPMADRVRVTGGLLLDGLDERIDPRRLDAIRAAAALVLGAEGATPRLSWRGLRPCTPDGLPAIGAHPAAPRVVFATGHGMLGVTLAAVTARMVAGIIDGGPEHPALGPLSPARFAGLLPR